MTCAEELARGPRVGEVIVLVVRPNAAARQPEVPLRTMNAARYDDERVEAERGHFLVRCAITRSVVVPTCPWPSVAVTV